MNLLTKCKHIVKEKKSWNSTLKALFRLLLQANFWIYYEWVAFPLNRWDLRRFLIAGLNPAILDMSQMYRVSSRGSGREAG